jgi:Flp pilus assembly pilin Flp
MREATTRLVREDEGLTTAEYAVGTVAVAGLGGVLIKLLTSDWAMELIKRIMEWAFSFLFS